LAEVPYLGVIDDDAVQGSNGKDHSVRQLERLLLLVVRQTNILRWTISQAEQLGTEPNGHNSLKDSITAGLRCVAGFLLQSYIHQILIAMMW
jgi:hypothetical protein